MRRSLAAGAALAVAAAPAVAESGLLTAETTLGSVTALLSVVPAVPGLELWGLALLAVALAAITHRYTRGGRGVAWLLAALCLGLVLIWSRVDELSAQGGTAFAPTELTFTHPNQQLATALSNGTAAEIGITRLSTRGRFSRSDDCPPALAANGNCTILVTYDPALCPTCTSDLCIDGSCPFPSCTDGVKNGSESDIDCGGSCPDCAVGKICNIAADCETDICTGGICQPIPLPSCTDGVKNGDESDIDCGGSCPDCAVGKICNVAADCETDICTGGICQPIPFPTCTDGVKNGSESDIDCGGSCPDCGIGKSCNSATDCVSNLCNGGLCQ